MAELLTDHERATIQKLGDLWGDICGIVGDGGTRDHDLAEAIVHLHALQQFIMSQAAGRAYPDQFRLLGGSLK